MPALGELQPQQRETVTLGLHCVFLGYSCILSFLGPETEVKMGVLLTLRHVCLFPACYLMLSSPPPSPSGGSLGDVLFVRNTLVPSCFPSLPSLPSPLLVP